MTTGKAFVLVAGLLLACGNANAAVYKTVDEQGNIIYTDDPNSKGKAVDLPPLSTVPPSTNATEKPGKIPAEADRSARYQAVTVVSPTQDGTVRDNPGQVSVKVQVAPALDSKAGDRIQYLLDGKPQGEPSTSDTVTFNNVDRGEHTVQAVVIDAAGKELKRSAAVRFYLHRQSVNFVQPKPSAPPPSPRLWPAPGTTLKR